MDTATTIKNAEAQIALAKLAEAMRPASYVDLRFPAGNPNGQGPTREVVFSFDTEVQARAFVEAAKVAAGKL